MFGRKRDEPAALSFPDVLDQELDDLKGPGQAASGDGSGVDRAVEGVHHDRRAVYRRAHRHKLLGLAFSGGGIRSATFNLGVLQGLAKFNLLHRFDYLSTVSGGGYIGSWLSAWVNRSGNLAAVVQALRPSWRVRGSYQEPEQIHFLREYSNYLTPRRGLFGADTWTALATYLRNLLLNLLIVISASMALLSLPHIASLLYGFVYRPDNPDLGLIIALSLLTVANGVVAMNVTSLLEVSGGATRKKIHHPPWMVGVLVILPILASAYLLGGWIWMIRGAIGLREWWLWGVVAGAVNLFLWVVGVGVSLAGAADRGASPTGPAAADTGLARFSEPFKKARASAASYGAAVGDWMGKAAETSRSPEFSWVVLVAATASGFVGGLLLWTGGRLVGGLSVAAESDPGSAVLVLGLPLAVTAFMATGALHVGLAGRAFSSDAREWWSRLGAVLLLWTIGIAAISGVALYVDQVLELAGALWSKILLALGWLATTAAGLMAGRRAAARGRNRALELLARISPYVFIIGLVVVMAWLLDGVLGLIDGWGPVAGNPVIARIGLTAALTLLSLILSNRIGINEFSLHALYRNRLARAYLGASNDARTAHPFTGFDPADDALRMVDLEPSRGHRGPYHIVNTALNLVSGDELAWQQRKATSFAFTPKFSGYDVDLLRHADGRGNGSLSRYGYRPTEEYGKGVRLSTPMAISGAAASPNMGYHTSVALAFLMTVFNVRLGWWLGNPRHMKSWRKKGPPLGLFYLLCELFGRTNEQRGYVYLSDGGHFENLGIYELIKRRCRFILACDASQDGEMKFSDLGNAIEKCRTDLGVDIEIDVGAIGKRDQLGHSQWHCSVARIRYDKVDDGGPIGSLVYIKPTLTGDEPTDLLRYAAHKPEFPHQSTADQWFDESQFESYRALGLHTIETLLSGLSEEDDLGELTNEELFLALRQRWYPGSARVEASFTRHGAALNRIIETIRSNPNLAFLDPQLYPEWPRLVEQSSDSKMPTPPKPVDRWLPKDPEEIRAGFYVSNEMIQLMENVYLDLNLEEEWNHPDNRGWMNLFRHWAWSNMFSITWAISASTFGARFQTFCERHLDVSTTDIEAAPLSGNGRNNRLTSALLARVEKEELLNFVERRLAQAYVEAHDHPDNRLYLLQLRILDKVESAREIRFPIGFAITAGDKLAYFRVQDHLRRMGFGRRGLQALIEEHPISGCVERLIPPKIARAKGVPEDEIHTRTDLRRLERLYHSVCMDREERAQAVPKGASHDLS